MPASKLRPGAHGHCTVRAKGPLLIDPIGLDADADDPVGLVHGFGGQAVHVEEWYLPGRPYARGLSAMRGHIEGVLDFCAVSALCEEVAQPVPLGEMWPVEVAEEVLIRRKLEKSRWWYVAIVPRPWFVGRSSKVSDVPASLSLYWSLGWQARC
jgi:hypothetical protein